MGSLMAVKNAGTYAGISSEAVKAKTGKGWTQWIAALDKAGAVQWPHKEIAAFLHEKFDCPSWWSQMVTVGYEQARGLRVKHQTATGFTAHASKTITVPVAKLYAAWHEPKTRAKWLSDAVTIGKANKNKSLRMTGTDGKSKIDVQFYRKGEGKSQVTIEQNKLANVKAVAQVKAYWSTALAKLKALLEKS